MNKLCKKYISQVKTLFPMLGKDERKYIDSLAANVEDYCVEEDIDSIDSLYIRYGTPAEVMTNYFSVINTADIIKKMNVAASIKKAIFALLFIILVCSVVWEINLYHTYKELESTLPYELETIIEDV